MVCHHSTDIARVNPAHLMNVEQRKTAVNIQTRRTDLGRICPFVFLIAYLLFVGLFIHLFIHSL